MGEKKKGGGGAALAECSAVDRSDDGRMSESESKPRCAFSFLILISS